MTWTHDEVVIPERWDGVPVLVGFVGERDCGCKYRQGVRLDKTERDPSMPGGLRFEQMFGFWHCGNHYEVTLHVRRRSAAMSSPDDTHEVWIRLFEEEVAKLERAS